MSWTEERVDLLKQLWGEGKTAAEIAKELGEGVTRNAVIGKAHRMKLSSRVSPIQQSAKKPKTDVPKVKKPRQSAPKTTFTGKGIAMEDLTASMCRWPNGDPRDDDFNFCGCSIVAGLPYCDEHARVAYQVSSRARKLDAKDFSEDSGKPVDFEIKTASA